MTHSIARIRNFRNKASKLDKAAFYVCRFLWRSPGALNDQASIFRSAFSIVPFSRAQLCLLSIVPSYHVCLLFSLPFFIAPSFSLCLLFPSVPFFLIVQINYASAHDNETLFDIIMLKAARDVTLEERLRLNHLATSIIALSQVRDFALLLLKPCKLLLDDVYKFATRIGVKGCSGSSKCT